MSNTLPRWIIVFSFVLNITGCDNLQEMGRHIVTKTKDFGGPQVDKIFPTYDVYKKDTKYNKRRFTEHLGVAVTNDVKDIYACGDFLGVDYKVLFAFICEDSTAEKIIHRKRMLLTTRKDDDGLIFGDEFKWWDKVQIELLEPYKVGKEGEYWEYFWYNPESKQAFYEAFSL